MENTAGHHHGQIGVDFGAHYSLPGPVRARSTRSSGVPRPRRRRRRSNTQRTGLLAIVQCGCYISGRLIGTTSPLGERVVILVPEVLLATFIGLYMGRFSRGSVIIQNKDVLRDNDQPENLKERRRTRRVRSAIDANHSSNSVHSTRRRRILYDARWRGDFPELRSLIRVRDYSRGVFTAVWL